MKRNIGDIVVLEIMMVWMNQLRLRGFGDMRDLDTSMHAFPSKSLGMKERANKDLKTH